MRLLAKVYPEYYNLLDIKHVEFRQIESITLENSKTHETRQFKVIDIQKCERVSAEHVQKTFPLVPWDEHLPVFAIELGDEISVLPEISPAASLGDRKIPSRESAASVDDKLVCPDSMKEMGHAKRKVVHIGTIVCFTCSGVVIDGITIPGTYNRAPDKLFEVHKDTSLVSWD